MPNHSPQRRSLTGSDLFVSLFSENNVILELCKERAKIANKRNDKQFLHRISKQVLPIYSPDPDFDKMFPSRRVWHRFRPSKRESRSSYELNTRALYRAVKRSRTLRPTESWVRLLNERVSRIRMRVFSVAAFEFAAPRIHPVEKVKGGRSFGPYLFSRWTTKLSTV